MSQTLKERYHEHYAARVTAFTADVGSVDAAGISEPHLPRFGPGYASAALKVAIVGRDTSGWGNMAEFLHVAADNVRTALDRHERDFHAFTFTGWTNNFGRTFWDTALRLLAGFHNVADWQALKRREHPDVLDSFVWAETNSVELWGSTAVNTGADFAAWQTLKAASERHLDSFGLLLDTFRPDVVVVLSRNAPAGYWDRNLRWEPVCDRLDLTRDETSTLVFRTDHPGWLSRNEIYEEIIAAILGRWREANRVPSVTPV